MLLKVTDTGPPIVKSSACFKNLLLKSKVHSVPSSENQVYEIGVNFSWT